MTQQVIYKLKFLKICQNAEISILPPQSELLLFEEWNSKVLEIIRIEIVEVFNPRSDANIQEL